MEKLWNGETLSPDANGDYFSKDKTQLVLCGLCGTLTPMLGTKRCDCCYELESRIERNPDLAESILTRIRTTRSK